jgi:hypothetical protein
VKFESFRPESLRSVFHGFGCIDAMSYHGESSERRSEVRRGV